MEGVLVSAKREGLTYDDGCDRRRVGHCGHGGTCRVMPEVVAPKARIKQRSPAASSAVPQAGRDAIDGMMQVSYRALAGIAGPIAP